MEEKNFFQGSVLSGLLKGLSELAQLVEKINAEGKTEIRRSGRLDNLSVGNLAGCYDLNIHIGNLITEHLGRDKKQNISNSEPLVDIFDEGEFIQVVIDLPEVTTGEDIVVELENQILLLKIHTPTGTRQKSIPLAVPVKTGDMQKNFKNGILKIIFPKEL